MAKVAEKLREFLKQHPEFNQTRVAVAIGISVSALNAWLKGTYKGDNTRVEKAVSYFLDTPTKVKGDQGRESSMKTVDITAMEISHVVNRLKLLGRFSGFTKMELKSKLKAVGCPYYKKVTSFLSPFLKEINQKRALNGVVIRVYDFDKEKFPIHYSNFTQMIISSRTQKEDKVTFNIEISDKTSSIIEAMKNGTVAAFLHESNISIFDIWTEEEIINIIEQKGFLIKKILPDNREIIVAKQLELHWLQQDPSQIFRIFSERDLVDLLRNRGLTVKAVMEL